MKSCVVCIPVYKTELNAFERISLQQCERILKGYRKVFVMPESLVADFGDGYRDYEVERFPDVYFSSTASYSELCLTEAFYERFLKYNYMLLYQLDSFVFYDRLKYFCELGYDYIGAPMFYGGVWEAMNMHVGNGGFSLRNIKRILKVLQEQKEILCHSKMSSVFYAYEDVFYGYCGAQDGIDFRIPEIGLAEKFAQEIMLKDSGREMSKETLPFGTHAWERVNYRIWKPFIESYGYHLPAVQPEGEYLGKSEWEAYYNILECIEEAGKDNIQAPFQSVSVWGAGCYGKRCLRILRALGVHVSRVFDWDANAMDCSRDLDYPVYPPTICNLLESGDTVIVAISKADNEVICKTELLGKGRFLFYGEFMDKISSLARNLK